MKNFLHSKTTYIAAAGALVLAAVFRGPRALADQRLDLLLGLVVLAAVVTIYVHRFAVHARRSRYEEWQRSLDELRVTYDVRADEELFDLLPEARWTVVFEALAAMPEESRSLREAIRQVHPQAAV